jgi:hypothetical protein
MTQLRFSSMFIFRLLGVLVVLPEMRGAVSVCLTSQRREEDEALKTRREEDEPQQLGGMELFHGIENELVLGIKGEELFHRIEDELDGSEDEKRTHLRGPSRDTQKDWSENASKLWRAGFSLKAPRWLDNLLDYLRI